MTTINNENILMMFEEINQKLDKSIENISQTKAQAQPNEDIEQLISSIDVFTETQSEKLSTIETLIRKEKRKIEFTPTSTFGMAFFLSMMLGLLGMAIWNYSLRNKNVSLSDNDLKFRYIQMQGKASANDLAELDSVFQFSRNSKKIKELRTQVEVFEENVKQRAKILEQEERLKRERSAIEKKILKP